MPRRPSSSDDDISLFPFLSVIACVIGVLTLMIATVSLAQMDNEDIALIEAYENTSQAILEEQERIAKLKKLLDEKIGPVAAQSQRQQEVARQELEQLLKKLEEVHAELEKQQKVKIVIPELDPAKRETISSMESELKSLKEQIAQLEKDIEGKEKTPEAEVTVLPAGSGIDFTPHFVECAEGAIVLHDFDPPKTVRAAQMVTDKDYLGILETVANSVNDTVIFLIRSDGLNTYYAARKLCTDREIRNGKLPIVGNGKIDLSRFARKK